MKKLLLVSYLFPPFGGVGVQRALSLAKYLPQEEFEVHVLTTRNPCAVGIDHTLQVPPWVTVHRALTFDLPFGLKKRLKKLVLPSKHPSTNGNHQPTSPGALKQFFMNTLVPDRHVLWTPIAIRTADTIVRKFAIETVLVTVPYYSMLRVGNVLKKRYPNIQLISDFRDEWLTYYFNVLGFNQSEENWRRSVALERETVESSDLVVSATDATRREMRRRYPEQPDGKFAVVSNGFDPETFATFRSRPRAAKKILITYIGTVYKPTDPSTLITALEQLGQAVRERARIQFIGNIEEPRFLSVLQNQSIVDLTGFVPQKRAVAELEASDFALLIWTDTLNIPGKLYDYMGSGKPTLVLARPDGEVWRRVIETRMGWCADVRDPQAIASLLHRALTETEELKRQFAPSQDAVRRYTRIHLAKQYGELMKHGSCPLPVTV
jgi:glycosyltransferase involved in cell wall biosynthesis